MSISGDPIKLKAPFPYFGGKARVAGLVWERLGDVDNFCEPFCGSAAILLGRPTAPRIETINDADCYVANFWRATSFDPHTVAAYADWPVNEADLHSRHRWLVLSDHAADFRDKIRQDPDYFDPKVAGWWAWGLCCWIGSGWCEASRAESEQLPKLAGGTYGYGGSHLHADKIPDKRPILAAPENESGRRSHHGIGVHGISDTHRPQLADAHSRGRGVHANDAAGTCEQRREWLVDWFGRLRDRLRTVRVCCGDWKRVCSSPSVTTRLGLTGIFLDPPYAKTKTDGTENRSANLYGNDKTQDVDQMVSDVRAYCLERGDDPKMRIVLAGYEGEGHEPLEDAGWKVVAWKSAGGYGNRTDKGQENAARERLWFSPHCIDPEAARPRTLIELFG